MQYQSKHEKNGKSHYPVLFFRVAALLACLTLITTYLLSGAYSKFFSGASGGDGARVARFSPDFTSAKVLDFEKTPGYNAEINFSVQNYSDENLPETAMKYKIILKTTGNIPLKFTLCKSDGSAVEYFTCDGVSGEKNYEYTDSSLVFGAGANETAAYKLQLEWQRGQSDARFSGMTDAVYLEAVFEQID